MLRVAIAVIIGSRIYLNSNNKNLVHSWSRFKLSKCFCSTFSARFVFQYPSSLCNVSTSLLRSLPQHFKTFCDFVILFVIKTRCLYNTRREIDKKTSLKSWCGNSFDLILIDVQRANSDRGGAVRCAPLHVHYLLAFYINKTH